MYFIGFFFFLPSFFFISHCLTCLPGVNSQDIFSGFVFIRTQIRHWVSKILHFHYLNYNESQFLGRVIIELITCWQSDECELYKIVNVKWLGIHFHVIDHEIVHINL